MEDVHKVNSTDNPPILWILGPWSTPDTNTGYSNIHGAIYGFASASLAITTITTLLRLYTKFHYFKVRRWDDYLMIASWCGLVCMWAFILVSVKYGAGDHQINVSSIYYPQFEKYAFLHELFYSIVQCLLKTSIALQILHIFVPNLHIRTNRTATFWIIVGFTVLQDLWFFTFFWVSLFQCTPVKKEFNYNAYPDGQCIGGWNEYNVTVSVWNMLSDISMLIFPMICIWKVQMKLKFKIEAASVFFLGALAVTSSCLRLVFTIRRLSTDDLTLVLTQIALCDTGEITAGILVGNFVPLPRLIFEITHKIKITLHPELKRPPGTLSTTTMTTLASSGRSHSTRNPSSATASRAVSAPFRDRDDSLLGPERNMSTISSQMMSFEELVRFSGQRP